MNLPNVLTVIRLLLVPVFAVLFVMDCFFEAVLVFIFCGATDIVDGYIARKYNMITAFGKLADPFADKVLQVTALILLTVKGMIPMAAVIAISLKELTMLLGSAFLYKRKVVVFADWYGKLATVLLFIAICLNIYVNIRKTQNEIITVAAQITLWVGVAATLLAFFGYLRQFVRILNGKQTQVHTQEVP